MTRRLFAAFAKTSWRAASRRPRCHTILPTTGNDPTKMRIDGEHDDFHDHSARPRGDAHADAKAEERVAATPPGSASSRKVFIDLKSLGRASVNDSEDPHSIKFQPTQPAAPFNPHDVPLVSPVLRLAEMQQVTAAAGPLHASLYRSKDTVLWEVFSCASPVRNTLVTASVFFRRAGIAAAEYRHVDTGNKEPVVARRFITGLDTALELLRAPALASGNGVYEGHMLDEWLGSDTAGNGIGMDRYNEYRAIRFDLRGILTHDVLGNLKPHFNIDTWRFGRGTLIPVHRRTLEIFGGLSDEFIERGALHVMRYGDREIEDIVSGNYCLGDRSARPRGDAKALSELLAIRRDQMRVSIFGASDVPGLAPQPLISVVPEDDPAIDYVRHASWPLIATLEFIRLQFPQAVFYVDSDGTRETISPGTEEGTAFNLHGFSVKHDSRFLRVYQNLNEVTARILSYYGPAGWGVARTPHALPALLGAAETTIVAAGAPDAPPVYIYVFIPDEKNSPFKPDRSASGGLLTNRSFKPLLTLTAWPREARPDLYTLPDLFDRAHPHYWGTIGDKGSSLGPDVFTGVRRPRDQINGVPLKPLSPYEAEAIRRKHEALNHYVDLRHPYTPGSASRHRVSAIVQELDETVWFVQDVETGGLRLPTQWVENDDSRAERVVDAMYEEVGFVGPILGYVGDIEDPEASIKTRYLALRRHAGAPLARLSGIAVVRATIDKALPLVHNASDVAALNELRAQQSWPDWHEIVQADEIRLTAEPGALEAFENGDLAHPYSKLAVGVHRIYSRHKIPRNPKIFHGRFSIDGHMVTYTGRRIEMYVSLPGKPRVKMTAVEFEREDAGPDEPTVIFQGGGPGASPAWYLGGGIGPIIVDENGDVVRNNETLLRGARLLFVDALGTGDAFTDGEEESYFNIEDDADITAEFVKQYRTDDMPRLQDSPMFTVGTSYGVQRWARVVERLTDEGIPIGGVLFVSGAMSYQLLDFEPESAISYACALVPYAATARQHLAEMKARHPDEDAFLAEVERFAFEIYLPAIAKGTAFARENPERFSEIAETLSDYIGLPSDLIKEKHLQISQMDFCTRLIPGETIAALDGRMTTRPVPGDAGRDPFAYALDQLVAKYEKALTAFFRTDVGYHPLGDPTRPYVVLNALFTRWDWGKHNNAAPRVQDHVIRTAQKNPRLRWLVAAGKYDVRSPATTHVYALNHLPPEVAERIEFHAYDGGHMFYMTDEVARKQFIEDVLAFIKRQTNSSDEDGAR
jgi:carboxypeptidase C (cathepsin A)